MKISYAHTSIVARDWHRLVDFYVTVFGCSEKPPQRDLSGDWLDRLTAEPSSHIRGIHLALPGHGADGPTLEIFQYDALAECSSKRANTVGLAHLAFAVDDVDKCLRAVLQNGGSTVGEMVHATVDGVGSIDLVYARDPEDNIVEIQKWS